MRKLFNWCDDVMLYSAVASVLIMMFLITADAGGRYLLNRPVVGAYEITEQYLMAVSAFFGICYAYRKGAFIRVTFLVDRLPQRVKVAMEYLILGFSILLIIVFIVSTSKQFLRVLAGNLKIGVWELPLWPAYLIIPIGLFFTCIAMFLDLWRVMRGKPDLFKDESPTT